MKSAPLSLCVTEAVASAVERAGDGILVYDSNGICRYANARAEALLALEPRTAMGRPHRELLPEEATTCPGVPHVVEFRPGVWLEVRHSESLKEGFSAVLLRDVSVHIRLEEALRESERRLNDAQHVARIGSWEYDVASSRISWSPVTFDILGCDPAQGEPDYRGSLRLFHPEDRHLLDRLVKRTLAENVPCEFDLRTNPEQGEVRWMHVIGRGRRDERGRITHLQGTVQDVTAQKEAEERLRVSEERFRAMSDAAPLGIFVTDPDYGCQYVNARWEAMAGITAGEARGTGWSASVHPEDRERVTAEWQANVRSGAPFDMCFRFRHRDGAVRWAHLRAAEFRADDGARLGYVGAIEDVTEMRRIEGERADRERELRETLDLIPQIAWYSDPNSVFGYFNKRYFEYVGVALDTPLAELDVEATIHPEDLPAVLVLWDQLGQRTEPFEYEARLRRFDGAWRWHLFRVVPILTPGGRAERFVGTATDIDARREAEEARRIQAERDRRTAIVLQETVLPAIPEEVTPELRVRAFHLPVSDEAAVGGDFYDVFPLSDTRHALVVGDVIGKGLAAALSISEVRFALRGFLFENAHAEPADALRRLNRFLFQSRWIGASPGSEALPRGRFPRGAGERLRLVAVTLAVVDLESGRVCIAAAGMEPVLVLRAGGAPCGNGSREEREDAARVELVDASEMILGAAPNLEYRAEEVTLGPGDVLAITTDGLTEARTPGSAEQFGLERLGRCLTPAVTGAGGLEQAGNAAVAAARAFAGGAFRDDLCLLLAQRQKLAESCP